jgi:hypothetical protein
VYICAQKREHAST